MRSISIRRVGSARAAKVRSSAAVALAAMRHFVTDRLRERKRPLRVATRGDGPYPRRVSSPREVLRTIRDELRQIFLERDDLIDGALVALLAAQHVLVIGPPGTAKSMLADEVCRRLTGARYFQWLLTRFTTPEELFGAVSLKALEEDDYRRLTTHKLPEAHIAFLDEVFKASSSILNTILTLMNERRFHNGREIVEVPLITLFAASNELPEDDELLALHDRFLLRFVVEYVEEDFRFLKLLQTRPAQARTTLPLEALVAAR